LYQKAIGEAHDFIYTILTKIMNPTSSIEIINQEISEKINSGTFAKGDNRDAFTEVMENNIFYNAKLKGIVCRLSAMLEELNCHNMDPHQDIDQIVNKLFIEEIDIEHIQSLHDDDIEKRQVIIDDWGDEINSIGNLMILERNSNRSVSNRPYKAKLEQYKKSKYEIVKKQSSIEIWNKEESIKRKMIETEKLVTYLFCNKLKISSL
jgi:mannose/fructose/N-acetylgalactosamine-specific phosphotransferase system component IIB